MGLCLIHVKHNILYFREKNVHIVSKKVIQRLMFLVMKHSMFEY